MLLEREEELATLAGRVAAASLGSGSVVIVEGPPGIGKTRLLAEARGSALDAGLDVLRARAGELERHFPFGMVRQLFEPWLASEKARDRGDLLQGAAAFAAPLLGLGPENVSDRRSLEDRSAALHGLYWLAAELAARAPLLIELDDVHWGDESSLRWVAYLSRRVEQLPIVVVAALRSREHDVSATALQLVTDPASIVLQLAQLSEQAVATYVRFVMGKDAEHEFCGACHVATGGNPFLLEQFVAGLVRDGVTPTRGGLRCLQLVPDTIRRAVVVRVARLPGAALPLARALAVLRDGADLQHAAALAGLDEQAAGRASDTLAAAQILRPERPLGFVHPIVHQAIYAEIPAGERASDHLRAARLLSDGGAADEAIAAHLMLTDPGAREWVVEKLRDAARNALARGAPDAAVRCLVRAMHEPPPPPARVGVLWELGVAEARAGHPAAAEILGQALSLADEPREQALIALALGRVLTLSGQGSEAIEALQTAIAGLGDGDRELALRLEADLNLAAWYAVPPRPAVTARLAALRTRIAGRRPGDQLVLANLAFQAAMAGERADKVATLAERALSDGQLLAEEGAESPMFQLAVSVLTLTDRLALAEAFYQDALADAYRRGSELGFTITSGWRAHNSLLRGAVADAEADARRSLELAGEHGWELGTPFALAFLVEALIERRETARAAAALAEHEAREELPDSLMFQPLLHSRGRLRLLQGNTRAGLSDLLACGARHERWGMCALGMVSWRVTAAPALAVSGQRDEALRLAREEVSLARRFGAPRPLAGALRAAALVEGGETAAELLGEAVQLLAGSAAALERARALGALGASLRHLGLRREARGPLREALDLAHRCGAQLVAEQAREELVAAGARPQRLRLTGVESLTPGERRVAALAAEGLSNPTIAQSLFVTLRTVEMHLTNSYRKLEIVSRDELPDELVQRRLPLSG